MMQLNQDFAEDFIPKNAYKEQWELDSLDNELQRIYGFKFMIKDFAQNEDVDFAKINTCILHYSLGIVNIF